MLEEAKHKNRIDLVLEGGGVRGIGHVGALSVLLDDYKFEVQNIAGTSAGSVVAVLLAAGYSPAELHQEISKREFSHYKDEDFLDGIPLIGHPLSLLFQQGIYEGKKLQEYIEKLLKNKGVATFGDLKHAEFDGDPLYGYKVQVVAADVTEGCMLVLPRDARKLGIEPDELSVAYAVRMSTSIPFFFEPVRHCNPRDDKEHIIVDGGLLCNYPVGIFDVQGEPAWPTFGLKFVDPDPSSPLSPTSPQNEFADPLLKIPNFLEPTIGYGTAIFTTLWQSNERLYVEKANFARTIPIPVPGNIRATDFNLSEAQSQNLYEAGRAAASDFLKRWNFERYKAEFRSGKAYSRRREISETLTPIYGSGQMFS